MKPFLGDRFVPRNGPRVQAAVRSVKLIELGNSLTPTTRTRLDMSSPRCNRRILGFCRTMRDEASIMMMFRKVNGFQRLRERTDLIQLDKNGIANALVDSFRKNRRIRTEEITADKFDTGTEFPSQCFPAGLIIFFHAVLRQNDRILPHPRGP